MFPLQRNRRLRSNAFIRDLISENTLTANDFIVPLFIIEGKNKKEEIPSMPQYFRLSLDNLAKEVKELRNLNLKAVLLFVKTPNSLKDNEGKEALNPDGLMQKAIKTIKNATPDMLVLTDVALDPYSSFGHDGVVKNKKIVNDPTIKILSQISLSHILAGADGVAPSDMMDGRILSIRELLEKEKLHNAIILSYSIKYASAFYGPFRDALDSAPGFGDKKTYQMDFRNKKEALEEAKNDIAEGADMIMVKPGMPYLDIINYLHSKINMPIVAYQVSGEYAMLKAAAAKGWLNYDDVMIEQLIAFKRAGARLIASYFAKEAVKLINKI